ncbi:ribonuclease H-like domain-containing protein [Pilobolus umbonatus]|nr:ribonuclease H-like domain-containing protein [Pilobolus umbonatus]
MEDSYRKKPTEIADQEEKARLQEERLKLLEERGRINKTFLTQLDTFPKLHYPSTYTVECLSSMDKVNSALSQLLNNKDQNIYGVDIEWPPTFVKGEAEKKTSLVQICDADKILLIQLSRLSKFPAPLKQFFEDRSILKSGVNIAADGIKLYRDYGVITNGLVDLKDMAESTRSPILMESHQRSLRALTGLFLRQNMSKGKVRISNWGRYELSTMQREYAALDAYASYQLYVELDRLLDPKVKIPIRHLIEENLQIPTTNKENAPMKKSKSNVSALGTKRQG